MLDLVRESQGIKEQESIVILGEYIMYGYDFKIKNFKKKCCCWDKCNNLQECIYKKIYLVLENINCCPYRTNRLDF